MSEQRLMRVYGFDDDPVALDLYENRVEYLRSKRILHILRKQLTVAMRYDEITRVVVRKGPHVGMLRLEAVDGRAINVNMIPISELARAETLIRERASRPETPP